MSTLSMQQSGPLQSHFIPFPLPSPANDSGPSVNGLMTGVCLRSDDRVLVIGRNLCDRLIGLAQRGCRAAAGAEPTSLSVYREAAEVVWITEGGAVDPGLAAAVLAMPGLRMVAVELDGPGCPAALQHFFRRLRNAGLLRYSRHRAGGRIVLQFARRPSEPARPA